jgi:predicted RNA-binding protein YlqC (UPF0109 family)
MDTVAQTAYPLKDLVEHIACAVVQNPSRVRVTEVVSETIVIYELHIAPEDVGRAIGKHGRAVNAIRTVLQAASAQHGDRRASLEIIS